MELSFSAYYVKKRLTTLVADVMAAQKSRPIEASVMDLRLFEDGPADQRRNYAKATLAVGGLWTYQVTLLVRAHLVDAAVIPDEAERALLLGCQITSDPSCPESGVVFDFELAQLRNVSQGRLVSCDTADLVDIGVLTALLSRDHGVRTWTWGMSSAPIRMLASELGRSIEVLGVGLSTTEDAVTLGLRFSGGGQTRSFPSSDVVLPPGSDWMVTIPVDYMAGIVGEKIRGSLPEGWELRGPPEIALSWADFRSTTVHVSMTLGVPAWICGTPLFVVQASQTLDICQDSHARSRLRVFGSPITAKLAAYNACAVTIALLFPDGIVYRVPGLTGYSLPLPYPLELGSPGLGDRFIATTITTIDNNRFLVVNGSSAWLHPLSTGADGRPTCPP